MTNLKNCPFCGGEAAVWDKTRYDVCVRCDDCGAQTGWLPTISEAIAAWNRRAEPENSRQHALQTGVCPMCEDCPDGCPVEAPNDSRNKPENEPLTETERAVAGMIENECMRENLTALCKSYGVTEADFFGFLYRNTLEPKKGE